MMEDEEHERSVCISLQALTLETRSSSPRQAIPFSSTSPGSNRFAPSPIGLRTTARGISISIGPRSDFGQVTGRARGPSEQSDRLVRQTRRTCGVGNLGVPIISDEVFSRYPLSRDAERVDSALAGSGAPFVFSLGGLSKLAATPK